MTAPPDELYSAVILEHARHPRHAGPLADATRVTHGDNPFCGDRCTVSLRLEADHIAAVRCEAAGCAISTASASLMAVAVEGRSRLEALDLHRRFESLLAGDASSADPTEAVTPLGDLAALAAVRRFPVRVKCARLPWQVLLAALAPGTPG